VTVRVEAPAISAAELRQIASEPRPANERRLAIRELARTRAPEAEPTLVELLAAEAEPAPVRSAAAAGLTYLATPAAVNALTAATSVRDPAVLAAVLFGLERLGGEEAFARTSALAGEDSPAREQADFTANLIAYRLGKSEPAIAFPEDGAFVEVSDRAEAAAVAEASPELAEASVRWLREEERPGIEPADQPVYELVCHLGSWIVVLNKEVLAAGVTDLVLARKAIVGVLLRPLLDGPGFALGCYVLTQPGPRGRVEVLIARVFGGLVWAGSGLIKDGALHAHLRTVRDTPGLPVDAELALFDSGRVEFIHVLFDSTIRRSREPKLTLANELTRRSH